MFADVVQHLKAMDEIIAYLRSLFAPGTPERIRINAAIAEMGIE